MTLPKPRTPHRRAAPPGAAPRRVLSGGSGSRRDVWVVAVAVLGLLVGCAPEQSGAGSRPSSSGGSENRSVAGADKLVACPSTPSRTPVVKALPDISLPCLGEGPDVRLSDLRGPLVVNVWAQWCGPCRQEAPYLAELKKKAGDKVQLLGIDYADPRPELAVRFATEQHWDYPHVTDADKATQQALKIAGPPLTAFVDRDGAVVYVHRGELTSQQQLDQLVREKLGVSW